MVVPCTKVCVISISLGKFADVRHVLFGSFFDDSLAGVIVTAICIMFYF